MTNPSEGARHRFRVTRISEDGTDDDDWCCDAGPIGHPGRHWKED